MAIVNPSVNPISSFLERSNSNSSIVVVTEMLIFFVYSGK